MEPEILTKKDKIYFPLMVNKDENLRCFSGKNCGIIKKDKFG